MGNLVYHHLGCTPILSYSLRLLDIRQNVKTATILNAIREINLYSLSLLSNLPVIQREIFNDLLNDIYFLLSFVDFGVIQRCYVILYWKCSYSIVIECRLIRL